MKTAILALFALAGLAALCPSEARPEPAPKADITLTPVLVTGCLNLDPCDGSVSK